MNYINELKIINNCGCGQKVELKPTITVVENKIKLSPETLNCLSVKPGDRIAINYLQINQEITIPVIGKADSFININAGNKVTKSHSVSFKGIQKTILLKYGNVFNLEFYKPGIFKLIPLKIN